MSLRSDELAPRGDLGIERLGDVYEVRSRPGVFSWDRPDPGSELLIETLQLDGARRVLDLGCGSGLLGAAAGRREPRAEVVCVDVDFDALASTRRTLAANGVTGAEVRPVDVTRDSGDGSFDVVLSNPPFHAGVPADVDLPHAFFSYAASSLRRGGTAWFVANRHLPYEAALRMRFGAVEIAREERGYKVLRATR